MDPGPPPRSASYTGSTPRALGRARALENDIGEEEAARPTLEQLLRSAFDDDSPVLVEARAVLERESYAPIGLSTLACWRPDVGACEELVAKRAHREAKPAAVDAEPPAPAPADDVPAEPAPARAPEPAAVAAPPAAAAEPLTVSFAHGSLTHRPFLNSEQTRAAAPGDRPGELAA